MLTPPNKETARAVCELLQQVGYDERILVARGGLFPPLQSASSPDLLRKEEPEVWAFLWCFFFGKPVPSQTLPTSWPEWFSTWCIDHGLVERQGDDLVPRCLLVPTGPWWIASDLHDGKDDRILPLNPPATHLMQFAITRPVDDMLDLCSGNGFHAVHASVFAARCSASDLNPRAEIFTLFNAALNGREKPECLTGPGFDPVQGRRFGLILSNPPFVISAETHTLYKDTPEALDGFCRKLAAQAPDFLEEGGFFQMIFEWVEIEGEDWRDRIRSWVEGCPCDTLVVHANQQGVASFADLRGEAESNELRSYLEECKVKVVHGGFLCLRRTGGKPGFFKVEELDSALQGATGPSLEQLFAAHDLLEQEEDVLLQTRPRISPSLELEERKRWDGEQWQEQESSIRLVEGLPGFACMDATTLDFLQRCDGSLTVPELITAFAQHHGLQPKQVQERGIELVRQLLDGRFLLP